MKSLRPVLFPGCYGHVDVFRIQGHTADMDITDSVDYKISATPRFYNISTSSVI
jgi:hypothetical protein